MPRCKPKLPAEAIVPIKLWRIKIGQVTKTTIPRKYFELLRVRVKPEAPLQGGDGLSSSDGSRHGADGDS